jgi:Lon protease-like protein
MAGSVRSLPMFPLGTVLFPYADLPLHVFEPRYRVMLSAVLGGDREFGVVLIERGHEVGGGDVRFDVGTVASVTRAQELPDGRWFVATVGVERLRVVEWLADDPYPRAVVEGIPEASVDPSEAVAARLDAVAALHHLIDAVAEADPRARAVDVDLPDDPVRASYVAARVAPLGPLDAQRALEAPDAVARLRLVAAAAREQALLWRRRAGDA